MNKKKSLAEKSIEIAEKLDKKQDQLHGFLKTYIKNAVPRVIMALIIGGVLKYVLDTRGMDYVFIAMFVMVMLRWGGGK